MRALVTGATGFVGGQLARRLQRDHRVRCLVRDPESAATRQAWGDELAARWQAATYAWLRRRRGRLRTDAAVAMNVAGAAARGNVRWARLHARARRGIHKG